MKKDLSERLLRFAIDVIKFLRSLPNTEEYKIIKRQLIKSSTSSGANYEEAQGGSSRADFLNKTRISLKEMRESNFWLKVTNGILEDNLEKLIPECQRLIQESKQLKNILGAICANTDKSKK